ncbi:MAG: signal peptidase II [Patescibacteria group bacterium]|jgi:signal peptidase II
MQTSNGVKKMIAVNLAVIFFISLDRFLKVFAFNNQDSEFNLLGEILKFNYKNNYNVAFSLPLNGNFLIFLIALIIIILILLGFSYAKKNQTGKAIALFLVILGASSNLYDRLQYGFVVDYLDLKYFTVFNLADMMIVGGVIYLLFFIKHDQYETIFTRKIINKER